MLPVHCEKWNPKQWKVNEPVVLSLSISLSIYLFNYMISSPSFPPPFSARIALRRCRL